MPIENVVYIPDPCPVYVGLGKKSDVQGLERVTSEGVENEGTYTHVIHDDVVEWWDLDDILIFDVLSLSVVDEHIIYSNYILNDLYL